MNYTFAIIILVVSVITIALFVETKESFQDEKVTIRAEPLVEPVSFPGQTFFLDENNNQVLSSGTIVKYPHDKGFSYEYLFNLPVLGSAFHQVSEGGEFNSPRKIGEYKVFAGTKSDGKTLKLIGNLERHGDGWHKLYFKSEEDFVKTCVVLDDEPIHCAEI